MDPWPRRHILGHDIASSAIINARGTTAPINPSLLYTKCTIRKQLLGAWAEQWPPSQQNRLSKFNAASHLASQLCPCPTFKATRRGLRGWLIQRHSGHVRAGEYLARFAPHKQMSCSAQATNSSPRPPLCILPPAPTVPPRRSQSLKRIGHALHRQWHKALCPSCLATIRRNLSSSDIFLCIVARKVGMGRYHHLSALTTAK